MKEILLIFAVLISGMISKINGQFAYPGNDPGQASLKSLGKQLVLENNALKAVFLIDGKRFVLLSFSDKRTKEDFKINNSLFELVLPDKSIISSDDFVLMKEPVQTELIPDIKSVTYVNRLPGKKFSAVLKNSKLGLNVNWEAHLRDGSNYVRQVLTFNSVSPVRISRITLIRLPANSDIRKEGDLDGLPIVHKNMFFAVENPLNKVEEIEVKEGNKYSRILQSYLPVMAPISSMNIVNISSVWGTTPEGQLRRGFNYYFERERSAPYHQMSFYNSWGDIAWNDRKMSERACIERIKWIGDSLINKRNVNLSAFLFDDGWDDDRTLWQFHSGFPNGFTKMKQEVESYGSTLGVWISPFGGYSIAKQRRIEYGKKQNPPFETNATGFSLAGPNYYKRYKEVLIDFVKKYDITMLKFDGVAGGDFDEMEAYLKVTKEIREVKPDLYFCYTTGTWASPFFAMFGDVVWRGGGDYGYTGAGSNRQKWITYRDAEVYKNVVILSPLYPINALQRMGIFICDPSVFGEFGMDEKDVSDDIWAAIASGTSVQGLYLNAYRMNSKAWNCLAEALNWAKSNESVMADIHWIGGNPAKGEVYGHAAWSKEKAVLMLRNPSAVEKSFDVNVSDVFELPQDAKNDYRFFDVKALKTTAAKQPVAEGKAFTISLKPFEVKVFDAILN